MWKTQKKLLIHLRFNEKTQEVVDCSQWWCHFIQNGASIIVGQVTMQITQRNEWVWEASLRELSKRSANLLIHRVNENDDKNVQTHPFLNSES